MRVLVLILLMTLSAFAEEGAAGSWSWSMPGPGGQEVTADLVLKADGDKLTGEFTFNGSRKLEIQDGSIKGGEVKFTVKRERPSGGSMVYQLTGKVDGNGMKGSASTDMGTAEWTAKRK